MCAAQAKQDFGKDFHDPTWPRGLFRRKKSYRFKAGRNGILVSDVWGRMPESDAIKKATRWNFQIDEGADPVIDERTAALTFRSAADRWLVQKAPNVRPSTLTRYKAIFDNFERFLATQKKMAGCLVGGVTYAVASDYITSRQAITITGKPQLRAKPGGTAAKKTVYCERAVLNQLFKELLKRKEVAENPFADIRPPKPKLDEIKEKHHWLSPAEEARLLAATLSMDAKSRRKDVTCTPFHDVILFMLKTGMREAEVRNLEWTDIDWSQRLIRLRQKRVCEHRTIAIPERHLAAISQRVAGRVKTQPLFLDVADLEKSGLRLDIRSNADLLKIQVGNVDLRKRQIVFEHYLKWEPKATQGDVPMCNTVLQLLDNLKATASSNFVFPGSDGGMSRQHWLPMLKKAARLAKISGNLRIHDLRHTCAVRLRERGVPLETISGILRHADIKETLIYAPYQITEGQKAILMLDQS